MTKKPLKEALKELGRLLIFSLPGALILFLSNSPELAGAYGVPILYLLRLVDKAIHESEETPAQGLVPF
jgi:hypothetical protein